MAAEESNDLISVIISDHRTIEQVFVELETGHATPEQRRDLADHVIAELVRHSVAEEQYLYPTVREVLQDGDSIADHEIEEHAEAEQLMKDLDALNAGSAEFDRLMRALISDIRHHIEDEEQDLLPKLQAACAEEQLRDLGQKVLQAKAVAPTRPHPGAPDTPPANRILDPGAGLVDRMRDRLTRRAT